MREAMFYDPLPQQRVRCRLCPHECFIAEGRKGICSVRVNLGGKLYSITYGRVIVRGLDPIEKKPLFHFLPGSTAYSLASVGCNMRCTFCQNWEISQWGRQRRIHRPVPRPINVPRASRDVPGDSVSAAQLVEEAEMLGAASIAYTFTEPTVFYEFAYDTALLARQRGLKNIFVTCGFTDLQPIRQIAPLLDAVNVDLKFFSDSNYRRFSGARTIRVFGSLACNISLVHVTQTFLQANLLCTMQRRQRRDRNIEHAECGAESGDVPRDVSSELADEARNLFQLRVEIIKSGDEQRRHLDPYSHLAIELEGVEYRLKPACGKTIITREGFRVLANTLQCGKCPRCGASIEGVWMV